ncbi:MAG TPA: hypothetical protein VN025_18885 [Candidatus Dormibacteraeota bacterium]|jgi:hypothetical protein|nr:hypothetical protein [Candidatus Dormibacteraeota bacterium]
MRIREISIFREWQKVDWQEWALKTEGQGQQDTLTDPNQAE